MFWASRRDTTRREDRAYCLLGIFDVQLPIIYGEYEKSFFRLQKELLERYPNDQSIFAWTGVSDSHSGLLATSPAEFKSSGDFWRGRNSTRSNPQNRPVATAIDVSVRLSLRPYTNDIDLAVLNCVREPSHRTVAIFIRWLTDGEDYTRVQVDEEDLIDLEQSTKAICTQEKLIVVSHARQKPSGETVHIKEPLLGFRLSKIGTANHSLNHVVPLESQTLTSTPGQLEYDGMQGSMNVPNFSLPLDRITLGFDQNLDPVCLLAQNSAVKPGHMDEKQYRYCIMSGSVLF